MTKAERCARAMKWEPRYSLDDDDFDRWVKPSGHNQFEFMASIAGWDPEHSIEDAMVLVEFIADDWERLPAFVDALDKTQLDNYAAWEQPCRIAKGMTDPAAITDAFLEAMGPDSQGHE